MIPKETVSEIIERAEIAEVVGDFVNLKRAGANLIGLCPFHNEKTPSFSVSPSKGLFKCFGCGKGGSSVHFIMEHEHLSYPEALRYLAKKYHIEIQEKAPDPAQAELNKEREALLSVMAYAQQHFSVNLKSDEGKSLGYSYFIERGFDPATIETFKLGYALQKRDSFLQKALADGYSKDILIRAGLILENERGIFDRFSGRVMFPIMSLSGNVIAFGGRILGKDPKVAKYINSPETELYIKSKVLYGISTARKSISENDCCYLVEGYTDVISLYMCGIHNVVASSGTSLTQDQIRLIRRYTKNIIILYDGDPAGIKASLRGIDLVLAEGMNVRVLLFPDGQDPDSYARSHTASEVLAFIKANAIDFIDFRCRLVKQETENDPVKRAALAAELIASVAMVPDPLMRSMYCRDVASKLNLSEQTVITEVNKRILKSYENKAKELERKSEEKNSEEALVLPEEMDAPIPKDDIRLQEKDAYLTGMEWEFIRLMLLYGTREVRIPMNHDQSNPSPDDSWQTSVGAYMVFLINQINYRFRDYIHARMFEDFSAAFHDEKAPEGTIFLHHETLEVRNKAAGVLISREELSENWEKKYQIVTLGETAKLRDTINHCFTRLQLEQVILKLADTIEQIKHCTDEQDLQLLMIEHKQLNEEKKFFSDILKIPIPH